jgi:HD-GYP domain-containing protein (c-di-GMP phosphodiesterase class II)
MIEVINEILKLIIFFIMFQFFNRRISGNQLELLSILVSTKDSYIYGHQEHCAAIANLFYDYIPKELQRKINRKRLIKASKLHDIGKSFISDTILKKPDKLTPDEYEIIKTHAVIGAGILERSFHKDLSNIVLYHHEWIDGSGYHNIKGQDIPIESQVISICDVFSALINNRPYRKSMTVNEALEVIKNSAGTQFDKTLVEYFLTIDTEKLVAIDAMLKRQHFNTGG